MEDKVEDKAAEDIMMKEAEVTAAVASGGAEERPLKTTIWTLTRRDCTRACSCRARAHSRLADGRLRGSGHHSEIAQPAADAITFVVTPAQPTPVEFEPSSTRPKEGAVEAEYQEVDSHPIIREPAVEREPVSRLSPWRSSPTRW